MWLPQSIIDEVRKVASVHYVDAALCQRWNEHRRDGELRLLTGWSWTAKNGRDFKQGFKTQTVAYRDAWYALVQQTTLPRLNHRIVRSRAA
jgi:hypothetical protein